MAKKVSPPIPTDTRSPMAKAVDLSTRITTISLTAVMPAVGGHFMDQWLGSRLVFVLLGLAVGVTMAGLQLKRLVEKLERGNKR